MTEVDENIQEEVVIPGPRTTPSNDASDTAQQELLAHELPPSKFAQFQLQQLRSDLIEERKYFQRERKSIIKLYSDERADAKLYRRELFRSRSAYLTGFLAIAFSSVGGMLFGAESPLVYKDIEFGKGAGIVLVLLSLMITGVVPFILGLWTTIGDLARKY